VDGALPDGKKGSLQLWVKTQPRRYQYTPADEAVMKTLPQRDDAQAQMERVKLKLFDFLLGNIDRADWMNGHNLLRLGPVRIPFDHGLSFLPDDIQPMRAQAQRMGVNWKSPEEPATLGGYLSGQVLGNNVRVRGELESFEKNLRALDPDSIRQALGGRHSQAAVDRTVQRRDLLVQVFDQLERGKGRNVKGRELYDRVDRALDPTY
jgi:hypothetical protein